MNEFAIKIFMIVLGIQGVCLLVLAICLANVAKDNKEDSDEGDINMKY